MTALTSINDVPVKILRIDPAMKVDDSAGEDEVTLNREFNVLTNGSKNKLTVLHVMSDEPRFVPGYVWNDFGSPWKVNNVVLKNTDSVALYVLEVEFIRLEFKTPFFVPVDWTWESATLELPAWVDRKGKPLVTTAGEPIVGQVRRLKLWILRGVRNVPGIPPWFRDYGFSVNSDRVKIEGETFDKNTLQLQRVGLGSWESQTIDKREYRYRPLSFELWFNPLTWTTEVLNMGWTEIVVRISRVAYLNQYNAVAYKDKTEKFQVRATNAEGEETKTRVFLDKYGQRPRDEDGNVKTTLEPDDIRVLKFDLEDRLPYKKLIG